MSKHIIVTSKISSNCLAVDTAGIGGSKLLLPGEISKVTCNYMEKSAEVIVIADNEPAPMNGKSRMVSQSNEGRNIKSLLIPNGGLYQPPESATGIRGISRDLMNRLVRDP